MLPPGVFGEQEEIESFVSGGDRWFVDK